MFLILAGVLCFAAIGVMLLGLSDKSAATTCRNLFFILFALGALAGIASMVATVGAGSVGVVSLFGHVQDETLQSGIHLMNPLARVSEMSVRTENYWMSHNERDHQGEHDDSIAVRSSDGLQMPVDVSVPYRLAPEAAPWVYRNLGSDYIEKLLRPSVSAAARRAASQFNSEQLYGSKRDEFAEKIQFIMDDELSQIVQEGYQGKNPPATVLIISQVLVGHVGIPAMVKEAVEKKMKADQEQQAMEFTIMREKKEAERKIVEAEGIHEFQRIVSEGIDERLLKWKAIEATLELSKSQNSKMVIIGSGKDGLPVLLGGSP